MGNICSTSQKDGKDPESEVSEGADNGYQELDQKSETPDQPKNDTQNTGLNSAAETNKATSAVAESTAVAAKVDAEEKETKNPPSAYSKICGSPIASRKSDRSRKIVIYVLMSNRHEYKHQLQAINQIFPTLWAHCKVKGFELTVSFTHHNIPSTDEKGESLIESQSELQTAHEEVDNYQAEYVRNSDSYLVPVLFVGSSLGRPHIPKRIDKQDFAELLSLATREQSDILQKFYQVDKSSQSASSYSLVVDSSITKKDIEDILVTLIKLMPINLKDTYLATVVEQEISSALTKTRDLARRCIWIQSDYARVNTKDDPLIQEEMSRRLTNIHSQLTNEIPVRNVVRTFPTSDGQDEELSQLLESVLKTCVDAAISEHLMKHHRSRNTLGMCRQIALEIETVKRHAMALAETCTNFTALDAVSKYIHSDSLYPFAIFGKPGEGKSTLATEIGIKSETWMENSHVILRFANLTELSSEISSLLASIAEQVSILVSGQPTRSDHGALHYKKTIENLLESSNIFLIIIIDSVDKVVGVTDFSWLPKIQKPNTKIILTLTASEDYQNCWAANELIKSGAPKENILHLINHSKVISKPEKCRPSQADIFEKHPFQAKIISKLPWLELNAQDLDTDKFIEQILVALESKLDAKLLETLLVIISISTYGIYETDCVNIFQELTKVDKIYSLTVWSKFCWMLGPLLLHANQIKIMDIAFKDAILKRYSKNVTDILDGAKRHFETQQDSFVDLEKHQVRLNEEKYLKIPHYDLAMLKDSPATASAEQFFSRTYFTDLKWMSGKIASTGCFHLLNDILMAANCLSAPTTDPQHIVLLKEFLALHMAQLNYDGSQLYTLLNIFLKKSVAENSGLENNKLVKDWIAAIDELKVTYLECLNNNNPETSVNEKETYNELVSLKTPGHFLAAMNTECNEICVWDVPNCRRIRILKGVPQPSLLCSINDFEAAVLCKREIRVLDLKEGKYKVTLKGVMNQKVPYFGLHDESHVVCLSRNRMYVNLMNLETGDCVTSFKAGEDRFLNSLIVSGNGRILVCGDESQKPFSLLVWHLSQRRLLYDLRIPHHDLFTSLSAITYEGSYVTVVAKEIRESGPNFIVVYDLQSGTLFQKLKPACNTVAIAISQANGCVIAGLENAEILIWDLVTGNCRHTLTGHNAPVTLLKIDPLGRCLLSGDKEGRDLSLRLWELSTGNSLAVFSPPQKTCSCEILDNGIFIILALENVPEVLILRLRNYDKLEIQSEQYVNESSDCKIFELSED